MRVFEVGDVATGGKWCGEVVILGEHQAFCVVISVVL